MKGMTTQERIEDICRLSGLSEEVVRRVFDAERISIANSLRKGERATLIGRCVIRPEIRSRIEIGGEQARYIKLHSSVAASMEALLKDLSSFEVTDDEQDETPGVMIKQISALV